ncbi:hypothetical protein TeGR_g7904, partial [Tetraparma gracilis]
MMRFPDDKAVLTAALHAVVLLGRPMGGSEGMMFQSRRMQLGGGVVGAETNGVQLILDVMRRYRFDPRLITMSCWSLVNVSLVQGNKRVLLRLGGVDCLLAALADHPGDTDVVFRALFCLINIVIPAEPDPDPKAEGDANQSLYENIGRIIT